MISPGFTLDSPARKVNMNYTNIAGIYRVDAIAVRIETDNLSQLQNATRITLHIPGSGVLVSIELESSLLPIRTVNREQVGNYYLYSIVELDQQPIIAAPTPIPPLNAEEYNTDVIIEPSIANSTFIGSDYDALLNNTTGDRQSEYIQISDRVQSKPFPQNLPSILINKAIPASIQDSNYTNTGWTRGRYDGTKTDSAQYGGIEPALIGGVFNGAFFPQTYTEDQIRALTTTDITYRSYFFTGKLDAPTFVTSSGTLSATNELALSPRESIIKLTVAFPLDKVIIQPESILAIESGGVIEYCRVISITLPSANFLADQQVEVVRGFGGIRVPYTTAASANIDLITLNRYYTQDSSRVQGVLAGKLLVQDSKEILYLNAVGYAISGSNAPIA